MEGITSSIKSSILLYYHELEPQYVIEYEFTDSLFRTGYEYFFLNQPDVRTMWRTIRLKYFNTYLLELSGNMLNGKKHFINSPLPNVISIEEPNDKILYGYWVKNTLEYNLHLFFLDEKNSESMLSEKLLMENVLLFEDENEHQMFNSYVKTHWCNKDEYRDRDYKVYIPEVIGYDMKTICSRII